MEKILKKSATILIVDEIEPCLDFWTGVLGFEMTQSVRNTDKFDFVMLALGNIEVHLQTKSATQRDNPGLKIGAPISSILYFDVENIEDLEAKLIKRNDIEILKPKHKTFYGTTEIYIREPGKHMLGFAQV